MAERSLSRRRDHLGSLRKDLGDLQGWGALIAELIQNADDAENATRMRFEVRDDALIVWNDGTFSRCGDIDADDCPDEQACDFHSFRQVAGSLKEGRDETTGAFGIGFTSVYLVTDTPTLTSSGQRWVIDESRDEAERIRASDVEGTVGTTFELPWASAESFMRRELVQEPITADRLAELEADLLRAAPDAMLFLRRLRSIEIATRTTSKTYSLSRHEGIVSISDGSLDREWFVLQTTVDSRLYEQRHPSIIREGRSRVVEVAVPVDVGEAVSHGRYFATLPTDESTRLPISINGSFFPKPDRKRIRLDDAAQDEWNRLLIRGAAGLVSNSLVDIYDRSGDEAILRVVEGAVDLRRQTQTGVLDDVFRCWADAILECLLAAPVIPATYGAPLRPAEILLWGGHEAEANAAEVLDQLGLHLVDGEYRARWFSLRGRDQVQFEQLDLGHLVRAIRRHHTKHGRPAIDTIPPGDEAILRELLDHLLATSGRHTTESRRDVAALPILRSDSGQAIAPDNARSATAGTVKLLQEAGIDAPVIADFSVADHPSLASLVAPADWSNVATWFAVQDDIGAVPVEFDRRRVLQWFAARRQDADVTASESVRQLRIYPTGQDYRRLAEVALPSTEFDDPLDLASVITLQGVSSQAEVRALLEVLGAEELDMALYCTTFVPRAIDAGVDDAHLSRLLSFLADRLSLIEDDEQVATALRDLPLIPCADGVRRMGETVYFPGINSLVVGTDVALSVPPPDSKHQRLFSWLGVSSRPRATDVIKRCRQLRANPSDSRETAGAVLEHLRLEDPDRLSPHYDLLRELPWLPVNGGSATVRPTEAAATYRRYLFESQTHFLHVDQRVEQGCSDLFGWLGVQKEPTPDQVVAHYEHCRDASVPVNPVMWTFLDQHIDDPALERLRGRGSIPLADGTYVDATRCFWSFHPFGRFAWQLSDDTVDHRRLFEFFGVRDAPEAADVVEVLADVAINYGGSSDPVLADDRHVVESCWVYLSVLLIGEHCEPADLDELQSTECVLDASGVLRTPSEVLFDDATAVASEFDAETRERLIQRPANMSSALEAVGVRRLRDAITTDIVEIEPMPGGDSLTEQRLQTNEHSIVRLLVQDDPDAHRKLRRFREVAAIRPLERLVVTEEIELAGHRHKTDGIDRAAMFDRGISELFVVEGEAGARRWREIARELVVALGVERAAGAQASALATLLETADPEEAGRILDELGIERLAVAVEVDSDGRTADLYDDGATEHTGPPDAEGSSDESGADDPGKPEVDETRDDPSGDGDGPDGLSTEEPDEGDGSPKTDGPKGEPPNGSDPQTREGRAPGSTSESKKRRTGAEQSGPQDRERMRSYVASGGASASMAQDSVDTRTETDRVAIERVLAYERRCNRVPEEQEHSNPGFDIVSSSDTEPTRYIEVKGTAGRWDRKGVELSARQYAEARERGDDFWLYIVEVSFDGDPHRIQNPVSRISTYCFDDGWMTIAEPPERQREPVPGLPLEVARATDADIEVLDLSGVETAGYIVPPREAPLGARGMQVAGDSLGLAMRGGLVVFTDAGEVDDDDLVVVRLEDRIDPDTGESVGVRFWTRERDQAGEVIGIRLYTDGAVAPIVLEDPSKVEILGVVVARYSRVDLGLE